MWRLIEREVLNYISEITGLPWNTNKISCYVLGVSSIGPFSDPLTIPIVVIRKKDVVTTLDESHFIDILIHELIHNILIQNEAQLFQYLSFIMEEKYKNEDPITSLHIPIYAIHKQVFEKFFSKSRLRREIKISSGDSLYKRSWDIVQSVGADNILTDLRQRLKK